MRISDWSSDVCSADLDFGALNIAVPAMINSQIGSCLYPAKPPVCFDATFHVLQRFRIESRLDPRNIGKRGSCVYAPRFEPPSMGNVEQQVRVDLIIDRHCVTWR